MSCERALLLPSLGKSQKRAVFRWKLGHQVFHLQLVAINSLLEESLQALKEGAYERFRRRISELCRLYDASTATMAYAACFEEEQYTSLIRPSMAPPYVSPGFSGLLNLDHERMLKRIKKLRRSLPARLGPARSSWPAPVLEALSDLTGAVQRNRENHGLICKQFVADGVSLLAEFYQERRSEHEVH